MNKLSENLARQSADAEWDLTATNLGRLGRRKYEVAVLVTCAVEPHNRHLPLGQDLFHAGYVARRSCESAWQQSPNVVCLPAIPFGVDCNLMDFPMTVHLSQATLDKVLAEVIDSLRKHGIRKFVIVNGHGGNDFGPFIRQIQSDLDVHVFLCDWWQVGADRYDEIFSKPDDHAGQFETSIGLDLCPQLVELEAAGDGKTRPFRFEALEKGWVRTSRKFARLNDHCAAGDPTGASAEKGQQYLDLVCERISNFLVELAQAEIDEKFPHVP